MRKRKALKGGYTYANPVMAGPLLKETLYRATEDDIIGIKSSYTERLNAAEQDLNQIKKNQTEANKSYYSKQQLDAANAAIFQREDADNRKSTLTLIKMSASAFAAITKGLWAVCKFMVSNVKFVIKMIGTAGQGAIIKALLFIIFIILVIVGITKGISGLNNNQTTISNSSQFGKEILKQDNDKYLAIPQPNTRLKQMHEYINTLIPKEYKYNWGTIANSVSYITTGKNQYEEFLSDREETLIGRSDNIFHINFNDYDKDKTFSIIEPKNVLLEFNENAYYNSDYNKIDSNFNAVINYPKKCLLNIKPNEKGKYILDLNKDNIKYYDKNNSIIANNNLITPIFKYSTNNSNLIVGVKLNSFDNKLYLGYNNANNVLGAYATTLINPNYKGPILRLTNLTFTNRASVNTEAENKGINRTANFYNDYKTNELYTIIDNKKIYYNDFFTSTTCVTAIYDQSGNNNHLIYRVANDFVHMPELKKENDKYSVHFYQRHILIFIKPISYKKIKITTKILLMNITDGSKVVPMDFLAREKEEVIKIQGTDDINFVFTTTKKTDIIDTDQISDKYLISDNNIRVLKKIYPYDIETKYIYNKDKSPIILEYLGNALDKRTFEEKRDDDTINRKGKNLQDKLNNYSFKGFLYELRIFKSDED